MKQIDNMIKEHPYVSTWRGHKMYPSDMGMNYYDILDIAHGLGNAARFGNQSDKVITVAQHSVVGSYLVSPEYSLEFLFHDVSECYTHDMPKPIKCVLPDFQLFEHKLSQSIWRQYGLPSELSDQVHEIDSRIAIDEALVAFKRIPHWAMEYKHEAFGIKITPWSRQTSMLRWYQRYVELTTNMTHDLSPYTLANTARLVQIFQGAEQ